MSQQAVNHTYPIFVNNIPAYRIHAFDAYPELNYAIFTRQGGVSQAPYQSLNLGSTVGDDPTAVQTNFTRVCQALDIHPNQTVSCYQVHSANILTVDRDNCQRIMGQADGLITAELDIYLNLRFADCTPLLFYDPVRQAIGLAHAGWRGTMQNAAGATVQAMVNQLGCQADNIIAVIGPAIGPCCYEVGPGVIEAAANTFVNSASLFQPNGKVDHGHFDMGAANRRQLAAGGVKQIIQSGLCTACRTDEFFSHRAENGQTGRFGVMMGLRGMA
jgi:hypothetical protein